MMFIQDTNTCKNSAIYVRLRRTIKKIHTNKHRNTYSEEIHGLKERDTYVTAVHINLIHNNTHSSLRLH